MNYIYFFVLITSVLAENWATYPSVPKTASVNGFADPILPNLPACALDCVKLSTKNTPCPYWDTGCLCVMPQWSGLVAECIAKSCKASDVASATALAYSLCSRVGANVWMMPASVSSLISNAASGVKVVAASTSEGEANLSGMALGQSAAITSGSSTSNSTASSTTTSSGDSSSSASGGSSSASNGAVPMNVINFGLFGILIAGSLSYLG